MKTQKEPSMEFTGERLIPQINKENAFFYEHLARYIFASQFVKNKKVLDAGCGSGYGSHILDKYGKAKKITAIDNSEEAIKYARNLYGSKKINFLVDNVEKLSTIKGNSIDVVNAYEIIEHLSDQINFLINIVRILKDSGSLFVSTPNKYTYPKGNPYHTKEFYPDEFYKLLRRYFKYVGIYHQNYEFCQIIKQEGKIDFHLERPFTVDQIDMYTPPLNKKNSQYVIAICSNKPLKRAKTLAINSSKVDDFDLSTGLLTLEKEFYSLRGELSQIRSSKFYLLWRHYVSGKDFIYKILYGKSK